MRKCLLVLGMHRSGTSAFSGALSRAGIDFGDNLFGSYPDNPKGFYENIQINRINQQILSDFGLDWHSTSFLPEDWVNDQRLVQAREGIRAIINNEFSNCSLFGIKEPRINLLLPLYFEILRDLNISVEVVVIERDDYEVARSLQTRDHFSLLRGYTICAFYKHHIDSYTRGRKRLIIKYSNFLADPIESIESIIEFYELNLNLDSQKKSDILNFIESGLKHHSSHKNLWFKTRDNLFKILGKFPLLKSNI